MIIRIYSNSPYFDEVIENLKKYVSKLKKHGFIVSLVKDKIPYIAIRITKIGELFGVSRIIGEELVIRYLRGSIEYENETEYELPEQEYKQIREESATVWDWWLE